MSRIPRPVPGRNSRRIPRRRRLAGPHHPWHALRSLQPAGRSAGRRLRRLLADGPERPRRRRASEAGFTLIGLLVVIVVVNVSLAVAMTSWVTIDRRAREAEMLWRGQQYMRAIRCHQRETGSLPDELDDLLESNCLRRVYTDPMVTGGEWRVVRASELAELTGGVGGQRAGASDGAPGVAGAAGAFVQVDSLTRRPGSGSAGGGRPAFTAVPPVRLVIDREVQERPTAVELRVAVEPLQLGFAQMRARSGRDRSTDGIVGVVSRSDRDSLRVFRGAARYDEWLFVVDSPIVGR